MADAIEIINTGVLSGQLIGASLITSFAYLAASIPVYYFMFKHSKRSGKLVRMSYSGRH